LVGEYGDFEEDEFWNVSPFSERQNGKSQKSATLQRFEENENNGSVG